MKKREQKFEIRVRAVIEKDGKFLVCKHKNKSKKYYFLPGGHVEFGETGEEAIIRELKEELEISVKEVSLIGGMEDIFAKENGEKYHDINLFFNVSFNSAEDKSKEDEIDFVFLTQEEFLNEKVYPLSLPKAIIQWQKDKKIFWIK